MIKWLRTSFWGACLAVTILSLLPVEQLPSGVFDWWDKAQHALGFGVLAALGLLAYSPLSGRVVLGLLAFGAAIEFSQLAAGWRDGDWQDWLADAIGVFVVFGVWKMTRPFRLGVTLLGGTPHGPKTDL